MQKKKPEKLQTANFGKQVIDAFWFNEAREVLVVGDSLSSFSIFDINNEVWRKIDWIPGESKTTAIVKMLAEGNSKYIVAFMHNGKQIFLSPQTKQPLFTLKIPNLKAHKASACFSPDSNYLYVSADGQISQLDLKMRKCVHTYTDEGCLQGTSLTISPNGFYQASGSEIGVVNVYEQSQFVSGRETNPKPIGSLMNLTTSINQIKFHPSSQIVAISSSAQEERVRLAHVPTFRCYKGFPLSTHPIGTVTSMEFSPLPNKSELLIGTADGDVKHYKFRCPH
jgi:U3 small nucleolar RNA-associated protein 18